MLTNFKKLGFATLAAFIVFAGSFGTAKAVSTFIVQQGGTGANTFTPGIIYGSGTNPLSSTATTSVSCSGSTTCTSFTAIGGSPVTISSAGGGGSGTVSTSSPLMAGQGVIATGVSTIASVSTSTPSIGTGLSYSGTLGNFFGGISGTLANTGVLTFNTRNGAVTLSSSDVTTALGYTPFGSTNPLPVANGGTGSSTLGGILKGNGTSPVQAAVGDTDYQKPISLTTTGSSGAASFLGDVLNIPQYAGTTYTGTYPIIVSGSTISTALASSTLTASSPLTGSFTQIGSAGSLGCQTASGSQAGCLSSTDWTTFNGKQSALTFSTGLNNTGGTVTNTGVTSNVAGTGISVSGATGAVTISNTGVTSIVAGTNISISGATGAVTINSTASGGSAFPFTPATDFGVNTSATTTALWGQAGIFASSSSAYPTLAVSQTSTGPAATFIGGSVGIGTTSPYQLLSVSGNEVVTGNVTWPALGTPAGAFLAVDPSGKVIATTTPGGGGAVSSVSNSDSTLTISPTTGAVVASLNLASPNTWSALQQFNSNASTTQFTTTGATYLATASGNVGVGTTSPYAELSLNAPAGTAPYFVIGSSTEVAKIIPSSNPFFGLGTTTPFATLSAIGNGTRPIFAVATTSNNGNPNFEIDANGHVVTSGGAPTLSSCGTGSPLAAGNDTNFRITSETSATVCTATFIHAYTNAPICIATEESNGVVAVNASSTPTTVVLGFGSSLTGKEVAVHCEGYQ